MTDNTRRDRPRQLALHPHRIVIGVGALIVIGALSLPYLTTPDGPRSRTVTEAIIIVALLAPVFLLILVPDHSRPLNQRLGIAATATGFVGMLFAVVRLLDAHTLARATSGSVGIGPWLLVAGWIVTEAGVVYGLFAQDLTPAPAPARLTEAPAAGPAPAADHRPPRPSLDENPFDDPLFDSLEFDLPEMDQASPAHEATLVFEAEGATARTADEDEFS